MFKKFFKKIGKGIKKVSKGITKGLKSNGDDFVYVRAGDGLLFNEHNRMTKSRIEKFAKKFEFHPMALKGNNIDVG